MYAGRVDGIEVIIPDNLKERRPMSIQNFELELYLGLKSVLRPEMVAFELGTCCGAITTLIAKIASPKGKVHLFEASREALERARKVVAANDLHNVVFVNAFVGNKSGDVDFYLINSTRGSAFSTADPTILHLFPNATRQSVAMVAIDDYVKSTGVVPNVIKIDIEGAEYMALSGMREVLSEYSPDLIIETHGDRLKGLGTSVHALMGLLERVSYKILDLRTATIMTGRLFSACYTYGHAICFNKNRKSIDDLINAARHGLSQVHIREQLLTLHKKARHLVDTQQFDAGLLLLETLISEQPDDPEWNYLTAYCLHILKQDLQRALNHYNIALKYGFDEFWVRYNCGALHLQLGERDRARVDLLRARELNPQHEGVRAKLKQLGL